MGGGVQALRLLIWRKPGRCCTLRAFVFSFFPPSFLLCAHELLQQIIGEEQKEPRRVDKEENRWNANDKPPSALEDDQNLDTLQQSHNPLLQERSRHPIHALSEAPRVSVISPFFSTPQLSH